MKNNTMLARLGFSDPDKKNSRHDLACQYLAERVQALKLIGLKTKSKNIILTKPTFEHAIIKGERQYRTTIGFVDLIIRSTTLWLYVEVKITPVSVGDVIRQIRLYDEYLVPFHIDRIYLPWIVVVDFAIQKEGVKMLRNEGIQYARLGSDFELYEQKVNTRAKRSRKSTTAFI